MLINLAYPEKGTLGYEKIKYPDGQVSIKVEEDCILPDHIWIKSRMNSYEDLFYILSTAEALKFRGKKSSLIITCFLTQRSDRRFFENQSFDLKILTNIINTCDFRNVKVIHPHSDVLPALINNCEVITSEEYVDWAIKKIEDKEKEEVVLVSPDAGAYKQVYKYGEIFRRQVVTGNKSRDLLSGDVHVDIHGTVKDRICLIVDDYCDGGRTFINLSTKLKELGAMKVDLYVTHGLFSQGLSPILKEGVDHIYCTNSISDIMSSHLTQFQVI
jgi:ribose-phosphate pyrophosphokinase